MKNIKNIKNNDAKKILLFKVGAIGDTIMTTPFLRQLRKSYPHSKIDYLIGKTASQVLEGNKNVDEIIRFDESIFFRKKLIAYTKVVRSIKKRKYDIVFVFDKHRIFNLTAKLFGIPRRIGFDRLGKEGSFLTDKVYYGNDKHEIRCYLELLQKIGIALDYADFFPEMHVEKKAELFASKFFAKNKISSAIGIAPGGGKNAGEVTEFRNWPIENFTQVAKTLSKKHTIILLGGKDDVEKEKQIFSSCPGNRNIISLIGKCSLKESAAVIRRCNHFICNDSGLMHVASCVNKKIISIFGPTNPARKAPLRKESKSIWKDQDIYELSYELYGKYPSKKKDFFTKITIKDVFKCMRE